MVMDFGDLKRIVNREIVERLDHSFVLRNSEQNKSLREVLGAKFDKMVLVDYQPTCENMLADFAERLQKALPTNVQLYSLRLHETATSYAEWYASDN
jgi:6-pyruvoyltetrahydropterin/6-carboxytetrahydropterin synthase